MQVLALEHDVGNDRKDGQRNALLHHLQLYQREGAAVAYEAQPVGGHLAAVLEEGNAPGEDDDAKQGPVVADARLRQFKMPIPRKRHEHI